MHRRMRCRLPGSSAGIDRKTYICKIDTHGGSRHRCRAGCKQRPSLQLELKVNVQELYDGKEWRTVYE